MKKILLLLIGLCIINVKAIPSSSIVMDVDSGRILYQNNAYEKKLIASTTKIMTFVVAYEYARDFLDVYVEAGDEVFKMYGTSIYISYKEKMLLKDLLYGLMLRSGNDAAVVIANFVGGSEEGFVKLMNKKAQSLGMNNTVFNNPHGLDEETKNYSTAYDMALLSSYASRIPFYEQVTGTKYYQVQTEEKAYSWTNRNKMIFMYPNFKTGKTGYTPSAGKTFVSSSEKDNLHLTIVTLNDNNIYETHRMLYEEMFSQYHNTLLLSKDDFSIAYPNMYIKKNIYYPLKNNEKTEIKIVFNDNNSAVVGQVVISLHNEEIIRENIYYRENKIDNNKKENIFMKIKKIWQKLF